MYNRSELIAATSQLEDIMSEQVCWDVNCLECNVISSELDDLISALLQHEPEPSPPAESEVPDG